MAKTAQFTVEFDVPVEEDSEYFVEAKQGTMAFKEVAKGEMSPIRYSHSVNPGLYTIRVWTRSISDPTKKFGPSPEAAVSIPKAVPGNIKLTAVISK